MTTHLQLDPMLPVTVKDKGKGWAFIIIDYSQEHHLLFVVAMDETGEIWTVPNPDVQIQNNWTMERRASAGVKSVSEHAQGPRQGG